VKRPFNLLLLVIVMLGVLVACGSEDSIESEKNDSDTLQVVTSFTLIADMAREIGGDLVDVYNLVPTGTDPHVYSPLPEDIKAVTSADLLLYNGLNLEGGENGWFHKMMESASQDWEKAFRVTEGIEPLYIHSEDGQEEEINPHAFIDPSNGIIMAENTRNALIEIDPEHKATYEQNAETYIAKLEEMVAQYEEKLNEIPEENRVLVTSERAYQYLADRYDLKEGFIWMIDTEENGSPEQIRSLLDFIKEHKPPVLFVETNVDSRPMETVSEESGVEIYGELYSDEIGKPGEEADTYINYLQYNIDMIHKGLTSK